MKKIIQIKKAENLAFAEVVDEDYWLYLGTITVNGITYANTALVFNIPTQSWKMVCSDNKKIWTSLSAFSSSA